MKFKLFRDGYWIQLTVLIPVFLFGGGVAVYAAYNSAPGERPLAWLVMIPLIACLIYLLIRRKDYFSWVFIEENGIRATCLGKEWFYARWEELACTGTFRRTHTRGYQGWAYFSKIPIDLEEAEVYGTAPINSSLDGNGIFMEVNAKALEEISKYIGKEKLEFVGSVKIFF